MDNFDMYGSQYGNKLNLNYQSERNRGIVPNAGMTEFSHAMKDYAQQMNVRNGRPTQVAAT